jgi:hypothetical protein
VGEVVELKRQGLSILAIGRMTGYDRKTIGRYLAGPASRPVFGPRAPAVSKLEPFKAYLKERPLAGVWGTVRCFCGSFASAATAAVTRIFQRHSTRLVSGQFWIQVAALAGERRASPKSHRCLWLNWLRSVSQFMALEQRDQNDQITRKSLNESQLSPRAGRPMHR